MGNIYLYTGNGAGKTTNALGLALRSIGHDHTVVIISFLKWWENTGEYKIRTRLFPHYEIRLFGRKGWHGLKNLTEEDRILAEKGLRYAREVLESNPPDLLVLDEINLVLYCGLLRVEDVLHLLDSVPEETDVVLTGRYAPDELIERADFVNIIEMVKQKEGVCKEGIQY